MTSHLFRGIAFSVGAGGVSGLAPARFLISAEDGIDAFSFQRHTGETWYDASGLAVRLQTQSAPDPLGNTEWVDVIGAGGYEYTTDSFRIQRVTWGDGLTAIVLTVEIIYLGEGTVAMIRLGGHALPDPRDAAETAEFLDSIANSPLSGRGFDLDAPLPFDAVAGHRETGDDDLFTPEGYGHAWEGGIRGGAGNDTIFGRIGDDTLYGGTGDDVLGGHWGANTLSGGDGDDHIEAHGGPRYTGGNVILSGCRLDGGTGHDTVFGSDVSFDTIFGRSGNDSLTGFGGEGYWGSDSQLPDAGDTILGGLGRDTIRGAEGRDRLFGGSGDDSIAGGAGSDTMTGGGGADMFSFAQFSGVDAITDFDLALDGLDMTAVTSEIAILAHAGGTVLDWGDGAVLIEGIRRADFLDAGIL